MKAFGDDVISYLTSSTIIDSLRTLEPLRDKVGLNEVSRCPQEDIASITLKKFNFVE